MTSLSSLSLSSLPSLSPSLPLFPPSFPSLPFSQVKLLKNVLEEWKREVEKKPPEMSVDQAYDTLGLPTGVGGSVVVFVSHSQDTHSDLGMRLSCCCLVSL